MAGRVFHCGYEAGCLGYTLYHQLVEHGVDCTILASSTMPTYKKNEIKTDKRDAMKIARCLAFNTYRAGRGQRGYGLLADALNTSLLA